MGNLIFICISIAMVGTLWTSRMLRMLFMGTF